MSSIDKLLLRGIRSFDETENSVIEFYTPLTVIVGHNGAGKTTVIEALKYATTGDLPPNSKNGAFILDPKMTQGNEVRAQVKLKFYDVNQTQMVVSRTLQLTQQKTKVTQKTLESVLTAKNPATGEQQSTSGRVGEIDGMLPQHLGVSKAILDNVIFCHQEESNWPLSDPATLKKKFDEIFAATRYTKVIENIKAIRKDSTVDLKMDEQHLQHLQEKRGKAHEVRVKMEEATRTIGQSREEIKRLEGSLTEVKGEMDEYTRRLEGITELESEQAVVRGEYELVRRNRSEMEGTFHEYAESTEELLALIAAETDKRKEAGEREERLARESAKLGRELDWLKSEMNGQLMERARVTMGIEEWRRKEEEGRRVMQEAEDFVGYDASEVSVDVFTSALKKEICRLSDVMKDAQIRHDEVITSLRDELEEYTRKKALVEGQQREAERQLRAATTACESMRKQLERMGSEREVVKREDALEVSIADEHARMMEMRKEVDTSLADEDEDKLVRMQDELEEKVRQVDERMRLLSSTSEAQMSLRMQQQALERARGEMDRRHRETRRVWDECTVEVMPGVGLVLGQVEEISRKERAKGISMKRNMEKMERRLADAVMQVEMREARLGEAETEWETLKTKLEDVGGDVPELIKEAEVEVVHLADSLTEIRTSGLMFERFIERAKKGHKCPLCVRPFGDASGEEEFIALLTKKVKKIPQGVKDAEEALVEGERRRDAIRKAGPLWERSECLRKTELPDFHDGLREAKNELETATKEVERARKEEEKVQKCMPILAQLETAAREYTRAGSEVWKLEGQVAKMEGELSQMEGEERGEAVGRMQEEREGYTREMEGLREERRRMRERRREVGRELGECGEKKAASERALWEVQEEKERRRVLMVRMAEEERKGEEVQEEMEERERREKEEILPRLASLQATLSEARDAQRREMRGTDEALSRGRGWLRDIESIYRGVDEVMRREGPRRLADLESVMRRTTDQHEKAEARAREVSGEASRLKTEAAHYGVAERDMGDTVRYREMGKALGELEGRLREIERVMGGTDRERYTSRLQELAREERKYIQKISGLLGEVRQLEEQQQGLVSELEVDYGNIGEKCRTQLVKVKSSQLAAADLDLYAAALNKAIMTYHSMKMEEINKVIREMWMSTYQGSDIDGIEIRSELDGSKARSNQYRIVMLQGGRMLEMRGRCSAGQKVLASLIVRLALAEVFCVQCGILALDEPTTNLDQENIASLAVSLVEVIRQRQGQRNFQLIVITHDEEFMRYLGRSQYTDHYWRVYKNERQRSTVERKSILQDE